MIAHFSAMLLGNRQNSECSQQIEIVELEAVRDEMGETEGLTSSLYAMTVRLSLEVSTQVTKSSICLERG